MVGNVLSLAAHKTICFPWHTDKIKDQNILKVFCVETLAILNIFEMFRVTQVENHWSIDFKVKMKKENVTELNIFPRKHSTGYSSIF